MTFTFLVMVWFSFHDETVNQVISHMEAGEVDEAVDLLRKLVNVYGAKRVVQHVYKCLSYEAAHILPIMEEMLGVRTCMDGNWQIIAIRINNQNF